jgi:hypothetical protein
MVTWHKPSLKQDRPPMQLANTCCPHHWQLLRPVHSDTQDSSAAHKQALYMVQTVGRMLCRHSAAQVSPTNRSRCRTHLKVIVLVLEHARREA